MKIKQLEWEKSVMRRDIDRKDARLDDEERRSQRNSVDYADKDIYDSIKVGFIYYQTTHISVTLSR